MKFVSQESEWTQANVPGSSHLYTTQYVQAHFNYHTRWEIMSVKFNYEY